MLIVFGLVVLVCAATAAVARPLSTAVMHIRQLATSESAVTTSITMDSSG